MGSREPAFLVSVAEGVKQWLGSLARGRCLPKIRAGISTVGYNPRRNRIEIDLDGLMGEWCACAILGERIDDTISISGDEGFDTVLPDGRTVDIKYNCHENGHLYFMKREDFKADVAILVVPTKHQDTYRIAGWISRERFMVENEEVDWGYGKRYGVPQWRLCGISQLLEVVLNAADRKAARGTSGHGNLPLRA